MTTPHITTIHAAPAANDDGPIAPATTQRIAA